MRVLFLTSTPLNIKQGSGTFMGIDTLTRSLRGLGWNVTVETPRRHLPVYTATRILFNESLRFNRHLDNFDLTVGFDLDGYTIPRKLRRIPHIASIKGVIADELKYETGLTRATMRLQAHLEARHVKQAPFVMTTSLYSASRLRELYGIPNVHAIVPELIDLSAWKEAIATCQISTDASKFRVLCVCRFYPRKRVDLLLEAAHMLQHRIPNLEVRLVGGGPELSKIQALCKSKALSNVIIRENLSQSELMGEYRSCNVFCLPSLQEGFGIVFLEAMASGKPIIAARSSAVPEVVKHGILTDPGSATDIANAIEDLYVSPLKRTELGQAGARFVENFDAPRVAKLFSSKVQEVLGRA